MWFKLTYVIEAFNGLVERPVFTVAGQPVVSVSIAALDEDPRDPTKPVTLLVATVDWEPPPKAARALRQLAGGEVPDGSNIDEQRIEVGWPAFPPKFGELPGSLREFAGKIGGVLSDAAVRTFEVVRWRFDIAHTAGPYSSRGIEWSDDLETWHPFPMSVGIRMSFTTASVPLTGEEVRHIDGLLAGGVTEPLAHYILREARSSLSLHTASALVMAITAAEIGLKRLTAQLVPDAAWLIENVPSPPLEKLLREWLPKLLPADVIPIPESILGTLKKGVAQRNVVMHRGLRPVDDDTVHEVIDAVRDLLWFFDYYAGHPWALEHLSRDRSAEIGTVS